VVGIDRDPHALDRSRERLAPYGERVTFVHAVYDEIGEVLAEQGLDHVDGVLFDLGVSSMQLDVRERGFAYAEDAPLDMRMNDTTGPTAADVLNEYPVEELARILREYGEERFARRIAESVVRERAREPFTGSARLVELIRDAIPAPARRTGGHPAKRTFQALRIEVNDELSVLRRALPAAIEAIGVGGRVVVMSYHSLEDRLTKQAFAEVTRSTVPPDLPFVPEGSEPPLRLLTRGAEKATAAEIEQNPRAASVRLRAVERVRGGAA
jgi:16S rRNA (cytosine1402-N4)-methyltransferase